MTVSKLDQTRKTAAEALSAWLERHLHDLYTSQAQAHEHQLAMNTAEAAIEKDAATIVVTITSKTEAISGTEPSAQPRASTRARASG